ncbi:hypothetical protein L515_1887, partial [Bordetella bronchiseptica MBORD665]
MRSGCLHDRPHTRRVCARREQDSAGACPHGKDRLPGFGRCLSPREGQAPRIRQVPVPTGRAGTQDSAGACPPCGDRHLGVCVSLCLCQRLVMRHHGGV